MQQKKAFFVLILLVITASVNGQFKRNMRIVGANVASILFNSSSLDVSDPGIASGVTAKTTNFEVNISPSMGWFISDNTAVGASLFLDPYHNKTTYESNGNNFQEDELNSFDFGVGGFARSYFKSGSSFLPFGQFSLNVGMGSGKTSGFFYGGSGAGAYKTTYTGKSSGNFFTNATLTLGMTKLLSPHTGLDFYAGYTFSYSKKTFKTTTLRDDGNNGSIDQTSISNPTTKTTTHGAMVGVGFQVFLEKR